MVESGVKREAVKSRGRELEFLFWMLQDALENTRLG